MEYIALDIGNVLCRVDFRKFTFAISRITNLSTWEVGRKINRSQKIRDVGLLSMTDILESEFGIKSQPVIDDLISIWNEQVVSFDLNVLDFFESKKDLQIALLSNVGLEHSNMIKNYFNYFTEDSRFKNAIFYFSCDLGTRKPNTLYYSNFLSIHPEFKGCIYLDDLRENLDTASKLGFNSVEFNLENDDLYDLANLKNALKRIYESVKQNEKC